MRAILGPSWAPRASNTYPAQPSDSATSPTTSPDHSWRPAASDPTHTLDCDEPDIASRVGIQLEAFDLGIGVGQSADRIRPYPDRDHSIRARHDRVIKSPSAPMVRLLAHSAPLHPSPGVRAN